ncbi:MAG: hypothetical protein E7546_06130 [Ruminococcaceae bacterium]|nr:hypothetical protein [Oscillospiraceae bacterium]
MLKRFAALLLSALMLLTFCGCWDMSELNERVFVLGIGVDVSDSDSEYIFTFQTAQFSGNKSYTDITVTSDSLSKAVRQLEKSCGEISFEHLSLVLLGADAARTDFYGTIDFLYREGTVRRQSQLAVSYSSAGDMLKKNVGRDSISAHTAGLLEDTDSSRGQSATMTLSRLFVAKSTDEGYYLPLISTADASPVSASDTSDVVTVVGAYCYTADGFSGTLSEEETELARIFSDSQTSGIIESVDMNGVTMRYKIEKSSCVKTAEIRSGKPYFEIKISIDCSLTENPAGAQTDEALIERSMYQKLDSLITRCKNRLGASPLGLDRTLRQSHHSWYTSNRHDFAQEFRDCEISLTVKCNVRRDGCIQ